MLTVEPNLELRLSEGGLTMATPGLKGTGFSTEADKLVRRGLEESRQVSFFIYLKNQSRQVSRGI